MTLEFDPANSELLRRRVLFAVALVDPLTGELVSRGVRVSADGLTGRPIVNRSGYFVWLAENDARPTQVEIVPDGAPFEGDKVHVPALPDPPPQHPNDPSAPVDDEQRLTRILLRPSAAYPFPDGATIVQGTLRETAAPGASPVERAGVELEWKSDTGAMWRGSPAHAFTSKEGEFTLALRLPSGARAEGGPATMSIRVRVERNAEQRVTATQAIVPGRRVLAPGSAGPLGAIAWDELMPV